MLIKIFIGVFLFYAVFLWVLYFNQNKLIFISAKANYLLYEKLKKYSDDIHNKLMIQGWRVVAAKPESDSVLIYFGGNAEDTSGFIDILKKINVSVAYTFNYRSYGLSEGIASEKNFYQDALSIYEYVEKKYPNKKIIIMGHSLGSAVAGYLSSQKQVDKLILLSPLSSLSEVAQANFKKIFPQFLVKHPFNLQQHVKEISADTLVILAENDTLIENKFSLKTYANIMTSKQLVKISQAGHNNLFSKDETLQAINLFIE